MKKLQCVPRTSFILLFLAVFVGTSLPVDAFGMQKKKATKTVRKSGTKSKTTAKKRTSRSKKSRATASRSTKTRKTRKKTTARVSDGEARKLLRKRGKLTRAERRKLSSYNSSRRRRARARQLARIRALRARDAALRSAAIGNIQKDNFEGEDQDIRRIAVESLQGRSGTVVVMDPNNGKVYSIVNQQMALGSPVKPCSTVKLVVGLAALHESVFDPNQDVRISSRASMHLTDATARSNNPVFQVLGRMLGYERVIKYAQNFGFGEKSGINYEGESTGFLPDADDVETGHMSSHGDGFGVTAVQLAAFTSAIANGGNLYVPRVPRSAEEDANFEPVLKRKIEMSPEDRLRLMSGMIGAVNFGTARQANNPLGQVAGKTGTCTGNRDKLGLFTSFSSVDNPKVVVTVITTGSTEAGRRAAEIAGRIYNGISPRFFRDRIITPASASIDISDNKAIGNMQR